MKRHKRYLLAVLALTVAGTVAFLWPRPRVTKESYERIKLGMTRREVEAVVGGPPGDYTGGPTLPADPEGALAEGVFQSDVTHVHLAEGVLQGDVSFHPSTGRWDGDGAAVVVQFSTAGRVTSKFYHPSKRLEQTPLANLWCRLRREWRRLFP
jgi:hypothetical protein